MIETQILDKKDEFTIRNFKDPNVLILPLEKYKELRRECHETSLGRVSDIDQIHGMKIVKSKSISDIEVSWEHWVEQTIVK